TEVITIFGKSWTLHVREALGIALPANLHLIEGSVAFLRRAGRQVIFDAEHFFDGFAADADYAISVLRAAADGGASRIVLCDTNGGSLPGHIEAATRRAAAAVALPLGIHTHNDCDLAVANALAAVGAGARHVQGTFNGWGERCGNANLASLLPILALKFSPPRADPDGLERLTPVAARLAELAGLTQNHRLPFVGASAFAHKGGIHASAVRKTPRTYEHIAPEVVGNRRRILVSDQSGRANVVEKAAAMGFRLTPEQARDITAAIKGSEHEGYEWEAADASLELWLRRRLDQHQPAFVPLRFAVRSEAQGREGQSHAEVWLQVGGHEVAAQAAGRGPVAALDAALRRALAPQHPAVASVVLADYQVRILEGQRGAQARVRVKVTSASSREGECPAWVTIGASDNILEASWEALTDALQYYLARQPARPRP
ncbi:MAG: citramalate synthase, partial [Terriglobales bacterium]